MKRNRSPRTARPRSRTVVMVLGGIVWVLVAARAGAPWLLEKLINDRLARIPEYTGRVANVDLHLWRGAYAIDDLRVEKLQGDVAEPFFAADHVDFSLAWRDLWRGRIVSDIVVHRAHLTFVRGETEESSQLETDRRWQEAIEDIFPIEITRCEIVDGDLRFVDRTRTPAVNVALQHTSVLATGLRNRPSAADTGLPARIVVNGVTDGGGYLLVRVDAAPLAATPRFDLDVQVEQVPLANLNDFLRAYAGVDVSAGEFALYLEAAAQDGSFSGYVKPFFKNLDFRNLSDENRSFPSRVWESIVATLEAVLRNRDRDQLGTRVPFAGEFGAAKVGTWTAVVNTMRNGFVEAFSEALEGTIRPGDVVDAAAADSGG